MLQSFANEKSIAESQLTNQVESPLLRMKQSPRTSKNSEKDKLKLKQYNTQTFKGSVNNDQDEQANTDSLQSSSQSKPAISSNISKERSAQSQGRTVTNSCYQGQNSPNILNKKINTNPSDSDQYSLKKTVKLQKISAQSINSDQGVVKLQSENSNQESQMDDFAIQDDSQTIESSSSQSIISEISQEKQKTPQKSRDQSNRNTEKSGSEDEIIKDQNSDSSDQDQTEIRGSEDPTKIVFRRMKKFYKDNYTSHKILGSNDFLNQKIWNVTYSNTYDLVYIFSATLTQVKGEELVVFTEKKSRISKKLGEPGERSILVHIINEQAGEQPISFNQNALYPTKPSSNKLKTEIYQENWEQVNQMISQEKKALQIYQNCEVYLELKLQIWNVEDRVILDKDHEARPIKEFEVLKKTIKIEEKMNIFEQMNFLRSSLGDYAQVIQYRDLIVFWTENNYLQVYDVIKKEAFSRRIKSSGPPNSSSSRGQEESCKAFQTTLQFRDLGKSNQIVESLLCFQYSQFQTEPNEQEKIHSQILGKNSKIQQRLCLKTISFNHLVEPRNDKEKISTKCKSKDKSFLLKDDTLISYYQNKDRKQIKSFFLQRISDSATYIMLFPTGLLLLVCITPFTMQAKLQLNLKRDEAVVDIAYCVSDNLKNQCFWLLDEKMQVWKCQNELSPTSCNWTLAKVTMFDNLFYKKFFSPAMTYEDFYMTTALNRLPAMQNIDLTQKTFSEFLLSYNQMCTRVFIIRQPNLRRNFFHDESIVPIEGSEGGPKNFLQKEYSGLEQAIEQQLGINRIQLSRLESCLFLIQKQQNIILNMIPVRRSLTSMLKIKMNERVANEALKLKFQQYYKKLNNNAIHGITSDNHEDLLLDTQKMQQKIERENEIEELIYLGKYVEYETNKDKKDPQKLVSRQFLVRRKRSLEVMFTNGLSHWIEQIENSLTQPPYTISDIILNNQKDKLIVLYSIKDQEKNMKIRVFKLKSDRRTFQLDIFSQRNQNSLEKNLAFNDNNKIIEIACEIISEQNDKQNLQDEIFIYSDDEIMKIQLPKKLFFKEFLDPNNQFERLIISDNGQLIMCGHILIQLSKNKKQVKEIGSFALFYENSVVNYKFLSLKKTEQKNLLIKKFKENPNSILEFKIGQEPITPDFIDDQIYCLHVTDELSGETSLLKIDTNSLVCSEIYQSNFRINNISMMSKPNFTKNFQLKNQVEQSKEKIQKIIEAQQFEIEDQTYQIKEIQPKQKINIQKKNDVKKVTAQSPSQKGNPKKSSPQLINSGQLGVKQNQKKQFEGGSVENLYSNKKVKIWIALVAGTSTHVSIEVITDEIQIKNPQKTDEFENSQSTNQELNHQSLDDENKPLNAMKKSFTFMSSVANFVKQKSVTLVNKSQMEQFINIAVGEDLRTSSEIGWVNKNKLVVTINNQYYLISLDKRKRMCKANNGIYYGQQVVNMNLFCSIVKKKKQIANNKENEPQNIEIQSFMQTKVSKQTKNQLIESQMSIQRMETASLIRFAFIYQARQSSDLLKKCLLFFMPAEELQGSNMFSQLSSNYNIVQPYLEMIDSDIIKYMNEKVHNISKYLSQKRSHFKDEYQDLENIQKLNMQDNTELFGSNQGQVHMYQSDIGGYNAIDYAFKRNSIFCIKAFVETLLILTGQNQFNNCFDKAILKMISREMDVKELVNSSLFFVPIWTQYSVFSPIQEPLIVPYNNDIDDLEFDDPNVIFYEYNQESQQSFDQENVGTKEKNLLQTKSAFYQSESQKALLEKPKEEQYEMQFKYINLLEIQGNDKISISRTLKDCQDIELFEQDSIQQIIDYKWNTYTRKFFLFKFYVYLIFLIFYFIDLERAMNDLQYNKGIRTKDELFIACKTITFGIQLMFLLYEILQAKTEGKQYFSDVWNYIEILGLFIFGAAGIMDILNEQVSDASRILWTISIFSALQKVAYLVRVFTQLNFLVTMLGVVINDIGWFICLFFVYVLFFAEINHIYQINTSQFQRLPNLAAQFIFCVKNALGDFSLMDATSGFDQVLSTDELGNIIYGNSTEVMVFTYLFWLLTIFYLTMIFMNFIIAVIGDSFNKVLEHKQAHDYFTRINMIYEREVYFGPKDFEDRINFPNILIVRQGKENNSKIESSSKQKELNLIKTFMKLQIQKHTEQVSQTVLEQKTHLSNSIKILENDITNQNKDLEKIQNELKNIISNTNQINDLCKQNINLNNLLSTQQQQIIAKDTQSSDSDTVSSDTDDIDGDNLKKIKGQMTIKIKKLSNDSLSKKKPVLHIKNDICEVALEEQNSIRKQTKQKLKKVEVITSPTSNKSMISRKDIEIFSNGKQSNISFPLGQQSPTNAHGIWMISQNVKKQLENNSKLINKQVQTMKETFHSKVDEIVKDNNLLKKQLQISSQLQRQSVEWMQLMQQRFEETNNQNLNQIKNLQKSINHLIQCQTQSSNRLSPKEMPPKTSMESRSSSMIFKNILKLDQPTRFERNFSAVQRINSTQIPIYNFPKNNSYTQSREISRDMLIQTPNIRSNTQARNNASPKNSLKNLK